MGLFSFLQRAGAKPDAPALLIDEEGRILTDAEGNPVQVAALASPAQPTAEPREPAPAITPQAAALDFDNHPQAKALRDQVTRLEAEATRRATQERDNAIAAINASAATFADGLVSSNHLMPPGRDHAATLQRFTALAAAGLPTEGIDVQAAWQGFTAALPAHRLTRELTAADLPSGSRVLPNGAGGDDAYDPIATAHQMNDAHYGAENRVGGRTNGRANGRG